MSPALTREQVLAHRIAAQGLHREASSVGELGVLDIGVQDAMGQPSAVLFAARVKEVGAATPPVGPGHRLTLAWTLRGAPHIHRRADLDPIARALYPLSEADAGARLNESGPAVKRAGITAMEQLETAVRELRAVVRKPIEKGAASTAVTKRLPEAMRHACRVCKAAHISDSAMRTAAALGGLELEPGTSPPVLLRRVGAKPPKRADPAAVADLARAYLTYLGPATDAEFAGYLDARRADVRALWPPDGLVEVTVEGRTAWLPEAAVDDVTAAPDPSIVRLLGPYDPYLQARDRTLIVPDKSVHKAMWPVLGRPGAVLADGEVTALWRTKASPKLLTITVEPFAKLPKTVWTQLEAEAQRVAAVRGAADVRVVRAE